MLSGHVIISHRQDIGGFLIRHDGSLDATLTDQSVAAFAYTLGPKADPELLLAPHGPDAVERFTALLLAASATPSRNFEPLYRIALKPPDDEDMADAFRAVASYPSVARSIVDWVSEEAAVHAYWTTTCLGLMQARRRAIGPHRLTSLHLAFLKERNRALWCALSTLGAPGHMLDGLGIMAHYRAETIKDGKIEAPYVIRAAESLRDYVMHELD